MKKIFTFLIAAVITACLGGLFAQPGTFYPNYFFNQDFEGVETLPTGWSFVGNTSSYMGHAAGWSLGSPAQGYAKNDASGTGARGGEIRFPSTSTSPLNTDVWVMEFDWQAFAVDVNSTNATGVALLGNNSVNLNNDNTFWGAVIAEFYIFNDNFFHITNLDPIGHDAVTGLPFKSEQGMPVPTVVGHPASATNGDWFGRRGDTQAIVDSLNATTKTNVTFTVGAWYHIMVEMNFATQKVLQMSITEIENPTNTATITNKDFVAPYHYGTSPSVEAANRVVTQLDRIALWGTRKSNGNGVVRHYLDNIKTYVWKESVGVADVTINYVDRDGVPVKAAKVMQNQQVTSTLWLNINDKANFNDGAYFYFYDADATHAANAAKGDGESLTVDFATTPNVDNTLTVIFKKTPIAAGTYVWGGNSSYKWNYLDDNFSVSGGAPISYQPGNEVQFSNAGAAYKEIEITGATDLGDANMTVSAADYSFTGSGRLEGNGTLIIGAPVTIGIDNRLKGGAIIETAGDVVISHTNATAAITTQQSVVSIGLNAAFSKNITGNGGTINLRQMSNSVNSPAITGFSNANITLTQVGRAQSNAWSSSFASNFSAGTVINVTDDSGQDSLAVTFATGASALATSKIHLGDNIRMIHNGTAGSGAGSKTTVTVGELSGTATSSIEGNTAGAVDNRIVEWVVGGLNTDARFDGQIHPLIAHNPSHHSFGSGAGAKQKWSVSATNDTTWYVPAPLYVIKTGTGKWTVGGKIILPDATIAHKINVTAGTLELLDSLVAPAVNVTSLTVDTVGTLKLHGNYIGAYTVSVNGTFEGGAEFGGSFNVGDSAHSVVKLKINSFTEGDYEKIKTAGDIAVKAGKLNFTVVTAPSADAEIIVLEAGSNYDIEDGIGKGRVKVFVNGTDITANTIETESATSFYYFDGETGTLGYKLGTDGLDDTFAGKEIRSVEYFNILGQKVTEFTTGITLQKITYTDDSVQTVKVFKKAK